jgi:hypothetical protein
MDVTQDMITKQSKVNLLPVACPNAVKYFVVIVALQSIAFLILDLL